MKQAVVCQLEFQPHPNGLRAGLRYALAWWPKPDRSTGLWWRHSEPVVVGNHYDDGVPGVFIPAGAVVPDKLTEEMWVKGRLAGAKKNRVKARTVDGVQSTGLFYGSKYFTWDTGEFSQSVLTSRSHQVWHTGQSWNPAWVFGQDVTAELGITFPEVADE